LNQKPRCKQWGIKLKLNKIGESALKVSIISFSVSGAGIAKNIYEKFNSEWEINAATTNERAANVLPRLDCRLADWVGKQFVSCDLLIFVGACGIAVRHIAPYLVSKTTDPAVLVIDDTGKNVISLLSGHIGGANEFAIKIASAINANPVITTSSDCNGKIAVDMLAKKNELVITDLKMAKEIESALLDGEKIGIVSEFEIEGNVPKEFEVIMCCSGEKGLSDNNGQILDEDAHNALKNKKDIKYGIIITNLLKQEYIKSDVQNRQFTKSDMQNRQFAKTLYMTAKNVVVGVGCRRGKSKDEILSAITNSLENKGLSTKAVWKICSIDLKKDEPGLLEAANKIDVPIQFFTAEQLSAVEGVSEGSEFVRSVTGVDNVCERAAIIGSDNGKLILEKTKFDGVTVALAIKERRISFE